MVDVISIFHLGKASAAVILGTSTTLLVPKVLASAWGEKPCRNLASSNTGLPQMCLPTCSAFSTDLRIFDGLSGPGKLSSVPDSGPVPVWKIYSYQHAVLD